MDPCHILSEKLDGLTESIQDISTRLAAIEEFQSSQKRHISYLSSNETEREKSNSVLENQECSDKLKEYSARLSILEDNPLSSHKQTIVSVSDDILGNLSMPGMQFIGMRNQHKLHSYLWLMIHTFALLISYILISEEYHNWQSSPVVKGVSDSLVFVNEVPFPAVTFCIPYTLVDKYDYVENVKKCLPCDYFPDGYKCFFNETCNSNEDTTLAIASLFCNTDASPHIQPPWHVYSRDVNESMEGDKFWSYAANIFPPCDIYINQQKLKTRDTIYKCDKDQFQYFLASKGLFGMCITVNGLRHEDIYRKSTITPWAIEPRPVDRNYIGANFTLENMLSNKGNENTVPLYNNFDDVIAYYVATRRNNKNLKICNAHFNDKVATVKFHSPAEIPLIQGNDFTIDENEDNIISITPKLVKTHENLISLNPEERGCYYSYEKPLLLFKHYNKNNCEIECSVNCSLQKCGCVPNYLPRQNISTRICIKRCDVLCDCECLPDCFSLSYEYEVRKEKRNTARTGYLEISYKSKGFYTTTLMWVTVNSFTQFTAYSFGILGVFNGFSVMVLFELFYLLTLKLWNSIKIYTHK